MANFCREYTDYIFIWKLYSYVFYILIVYCGLPGGSEMDYGGTKAECSKKNIYILCIFQSLEDKTRALEHGGDTYGTSQNLKNKRLALTRRSRDAGEGTRQGHALDALP